MDAEIQRSQIPGNRQRRMAATCREKAAEFRLQGKRKLAANAEKWAKDIERDRRLLQSRRRLQSYNAPLLPARPVGVYGSGGKVGVRRAGHTRTGGNSH